MCIFFKMSAFPHLFSIAVERIRLHCLREVLRPSCIRGDQRQEAQKETSQLSPKPLSATLPVVQKFTLHFPLLCDNFTTHRMMFYGAQFERRMNLDSSSVVLTDLWSRRDFEVCAEVRRNFNTPEECDWSDRMKQRGKGVKVTTPDKRKWSSFNSVWFHGRGSKTCFSISV